MDEVLDEMTDAPERVQIPLRMPPGLWERLRTLARAKGVSLNGYINILLDRAVDGEERREGERT